MRYAPVIIFAFNRLDAFKNTVSHLMQNKEASGSPLFVFVDGPRPGKKDDLKKVESVRSFASGIFGFKTVCLNFFESNKGLAASIIEGVSSVLDEYGRAIVLEDDLEVAPGFLSYMNTMLDCFEKDKRIMQISGFSTKLSVPSGYPYDVYLNRRAESWSWATWKDRWESIDWKVPEFESLICDRKFRRAINDVGTDLFGLLKESVRGQKTWAPRFAYSMFKQNLFQVSPVKSLVKNGDFSSNSTNCNTYNRYRYEFNNRQLKFTAPANLEYVRSLDKSANRYWTLPYRLYGKIRSLFG